MLGLKFMSLMRSLLVVAISFAVTGCGRNQRMDRLYAERCLGCHGSFGRGDGAVAASLPARLPDFRETVQRKSTGQIRRITLTRPYDQQKLPTWWKWFDS